MNIYLTTGTPEYLSKIAESHPNETMVKMVNEESALLLHETSGVSVFNEPHQYMVLHSSGTIGKTGFAALYTLTVTEEGQPVFEYQILDRLKNVEATPGFLAVRVLRPLSSQTYEVLTVWENERSFQSWKSSSSDVMRFLLETEADSGQKMFSSAPFIKTYSITE